jgi:hypothetical protein
MKRLSFTLSVSFILLLGSILSGCRANMEELTWNPVNESTGENADQNKFGPGAWIISSLEVYKGWLYAGTWADDHEAKISRTKDGSSWEFVPEEGFGYPFGEDLTNINFNIADLQEFHDQLYAGLLWYDTSTDPPTSKGAQIWRSSDGISWTNVVEDGFGDPINMGITSFAVFEDNLYAAADAWDRGFQIWRSPSGDPGSWTLVADDSLGYPSSQAAYLIPFKDKLVVIGAMWAYEYTSEYVRIWYTEDGLEWTEVTTNGFDYKATGPSKPAIFKDNLYLGAASTSAKANPIWRSQDGISWEPVETNGFEKYVFNFSALFVYDGNLFANVSESSGVNLYYSPDGETWSQVKAVSHGNENPYSIDMNPAVEFKGDLYFGGSTEPAGAQVWKLCTDCK